METGDLTDAYINSACGEGYTPSYITFSDYGFLFGGASKSNAEKKLRNGQKIEGAVMTLPPNFNNAQRIALNDVARLIGLKVTRLLNEPTAAALNYVFDLSKQKRKLFKKGCQSRKALVFDMGAGTTDISLIVFRADSIITIATGGNTVLGGENFTSNMVESILNTIFLNFVPKNEEQQESEKKKKNEDNANVQVFSNFELRNIVHAVWES